MEEVSRHQRVSLNKIFWKLYCDSCSVATLRSIPEKNEKASDWLCKEFQKNSYRAGSSGWVVYLNDFEPMATKLAMSVHWSFFQIDSLCDFSVFSFVSLLMAVFSDDESRFEAAKTWKKVMLMCCCKVLFWLFFFTYSAKCVFLSHRQRDWNLWSTARFNSTSFRSKE